MLSQDSTESSHGRFHGQPDFSLICLNAKEGTVVNGDRSKLELSQGGKDVAAFVGQCLRWLFRGTGNFWGRFPFKQPNLASKAHQTLFSKPQFCLTSAFR